MALIGAQAASALELKSLTTDYDRPYIYGIQAGDPGQPDTLLFISVATGETESRLAVGLNVTDLAVHPGEGRLYIANGGQPLTHVVDLVTRTELPPLSVGTDVYRVNAGPPGRILVKDRFWLRTVDTAAGTVLSTLYFGEGDGATDPTGRWYYHAVWASAFTSSLTQYDITGIEPTGVANASPSPLASYLDVVIAGDGSQVYWGHAGYDSNLRHDRFFQDPIYATTLHGELAFGPTRVWKGTTSGTLATLPESCTVRAVSGDQTKIFSYDPVHHRLVVTPLDTLLTQPAVVTDPVPAAGSGIMPPVAMLYWSSSRAALRHRVFFGPDSLAVATATVPSPEFLGEVAGDSIAMPPITLGSRFYWRVDAVAFTRVTRGPTWSFTVSPAVVAPNHLLARWLGRYPSEPSLLRLTGEGPHAWTVSHSSPWLSLDRESGVTPDSLRVSFQTELLPPHYEPYVDTLRFTSAGVMAAVPVELRLNVTSLTQMATDYSRPFIYALHRDSGTRSDAYLLFLNTDTDRVTKVIPIGINPTDMAVHPGEGRLYVTNFRDSLTRVVDLSTQTELPPIAIGSLVYKINAGRPGRVYFETQDGGPMSTVNTLTGTVFYQNSIPGIGDAATDPAGRWYYHAEQGGGARITRVDIRTDTPFVGLSSNPYGPGSRNLVIAGDGSRLFWQGFVFDTLLTEIRNLGEEIFAVTQHGEFAVSQTHLFNVATGAIAATVPASRVRAISADRRKLYSFDASNESIVTTLLDMPTPVFASVVHSAARPEWVRIEWHAEAALGPLVVERESGAGWTVVAAVTPEPDGAIRFEDATVLPATRYDYRLTDDASGEARHFGDVTITTPAAYRLALAGVQPNPATRTAPLTVHFSVATADPVSLEIWDAQGRRVWSTWIPQPSLGDQLAPVPLASALPIGVYFLRLQQSGITLGGRFTLLR